MMRRSQREYNPSAVEQAGQRRWNEAYGFYREQARRWFIFGVCGLGVGGAGVARTWYYDSQPKMIPYVIDRNGPSVMTAHLETHMPDAARIKGHLTTWVMGLRTVTSDPLVQKHLVDQTYAWMDNTAIGHQQLDTWYLANNPYKRVKDNTVDVDVTAVVSQGGNGWLIDWTETAYAREPGKLVQVSYWRMSVIVHIRLPETDEEFRANWDGVFTESMHVLSLEHKGTGA